jgi:hypothetical protein
LRKDGKKGEKYDSTIPLRFNFVECYREYNAKKIILDKLGNFVYSKSLVNNLFIQKTLYYLRMDDGDSMMEHINSFDTLVSQLVFVDINMEEEDKCITLLCYFSKFGDNIIVEIGSTNQSTLKFEVVVSSLLSKETRRKSMKDVGKHVLFVIGHSKIIKISREKI